ncbi:MAG: FtsX-like permease family protein [Spirochaetes bacterium]|nr:FtsX-like permease family protein [Spirochaetota bacterium]
MELILKIAWRNIKRHKGKSFIIGVILFLGALLMTLGNGVISGMDKGIESNIINGFMGDIAIISEKEKTDSILMKMYGESIETIPNYKEIKAILLKENYIESFIPVGKNMVMVLSEDDGDPWYMYILGVDFKEYKKMFKGNIYAIEGRLLKDDEPGILVPAFMRNELYTRMNIWMIPENSKLVEDNLSDDARPYKDELSLKTNAVFMGARNDSSTSDIRLAVKGIIKYRALNTFWGHFPITDIESYRNCMGYFSASELAVSISKDTQKLLDAEAENLDAMFGRDSLIVSDTGSSDIGSIDFKKKELTTKTGLDLESGIYNCVFVKLKDSSRLERSVNMLNAKFKQAGMGIRAVTWKKASGFIGSMAVLIKGALFVFVMILFFVAIIIIVNTLTMAALERTTEIGMMRAVGARKSFIGGMFLGETVILSGIFGGLGFILGIIIVNIIPLLQITTSNDLLQLLYGGDTFKPFLSFFDMLFVIIQLALVTIITVLYPVKVANSITPLDAIARE